MENFFAGVLNNITLLLALCFIYRLMAYRWRIDTVPGKIYSGLLFGGVAIIGMVFPVVYSSGLIFDGRTILLSIIGLFGGPLSATIAVSMTGLFRLWQGGVGMWMGLGTIATAALIGVLYHYLRLLYPWLTKPVHLYLFGVIVHLALPMWAMVLPNSIRWEVMESITVPVMIIYPIGTMLYGMLMVELEEREKTNIALQVSEAKLKAVFDHSILFVALLTADGKVQSVNRRALDLIGCREEFVVGNFLWETNWWSLRKKEQQAVRAAVMEAMAGRISRQEIICFSQYGTEQTHDFSAKPVFNRDGQVVFVVAEGWDISERKKMEEALRQKTREIENIAYSDVLTGLPNRAHLNRWLHVELEKARQGELAGAVIFLDLDDLKMVNDTFGHTCGDEVIIIASKILMAEAGESAFLARIGGDEFIIILPGESDRQCVASIANRMIAALHEEHDVCGMHINMSASAGVAIYPEDGDNGEDILKNADNALYDAKRTGKNCWSFYKANMQAEAYERVLLTNRLRHAAENGEFSLHYQPQMAIQSGQIVGFEALIRWNSPEHGSICPARFIPLAEQSGLIQPIGQWVLQEACRFAKRLENMGKGGIYVAVNVSPRQLADTDFVNSIRQVLKEAGIPPRQLELEITETVFMTSLEDGIRKLEELQNMGVRLSLDDFGTGYSSLTYLQRLPVNTLKIDKTFIDMIMVDGAQPAIIGSIVDMAHILNMTVVAEGVEKEQQFSYLALSGCDRIQGYWVSRPVPEEAAVKLLDGSIREE